MTPTSMRIARDAEEDEHVYDAAQQVQGHKEHHPPAGYRAGADHADGFTDYFPDDSKLSGAQGPLDANLHRPSRYGEIHDGINADRGE